jgi:predicted transcriptional regulator of viral defense system
LECTRVCSWQSAWSRSTPLALIERRPLALANLLPPAELIAKIRQSFAVSELVPYNDEVVRTSTGGGQKPKHSRLGVELVRLLASEGERIFSTDRARELSRRVGLKDSYLRQALHHLRREGWIVPLRRGLYALAATVPGVTPVHEFEIAMALVQPAAISHWSALHYHGLTDQVPRRVFILTTSASVPRLRGAGRSRRDSGFLVRGTTYQFIQVKPERFFGVERVWIGEARVSVTDPERTLLDGLTKPQYCGDFAEVLHAFQVRGAELNLARIVDYALRLDGSTARRLGWVLEQQGVDSSALARLTAVPADGYRPLDPTGPRRGPCDARWGIQVNLSGKTARYGLEGSLDVDRRDNTAGE